MIEEPGMGGEEVGAGKGSGMVARSERRVEGESRH